jgi:hypothetical protein
VRAGQLAEFNQELDRRLAALDRGEVVDPEVARARLLRKSAQRRKPRAVPLSADADLDLDEMWDASPRTTSKPPTAVSIA